MSRQPTPRRLFLDLSPLRYDRKFRWLWLGQLVNNAGRQVTLIALPFQLYLQTGSALAIGGLAAVTLVALLIFALPGGSLADAYDRRRLLLVTQLSLASTSVALGLLALMGHPSVTLIYLVAFVATAISTVDRPSRRAAMARVVEPERLRAALVLDQASLQAATVLGPALGGLLIAATGIATAYFLDAATFVAAFAAVLMIGPLPPSGHALRPGLKSIVEGLTFLRRAPVVLATFAADLDAMVFGLPTALFPILAVTAFHGGAETLGLLVAAPAVGAVAAVVTTGWVGGVRRQGRAVLIAIGVWGAAICAAGLLVFSLPLVLICLVIAGAADMISAVFRGTILQVATPDELRGRIWSTQMLVVMGGPRLGDLESTAVAAAIGAPFSLLSGGLLCLAGVALIARRLPQLAGYDAWHDPGASPSRPA
jgi:MFS family permease